MGLFNHALSSECAVLGLWRPFVHLLSFEDLCVVFFYWVVSAVAIVLFTTVSRINSCIWLSTPVGVSAEFDDSDVAIMTCRVVRCLAGKWCNTMWVEDLCRDEHQSMSSHEWFLWRRKHIEQDFRWHNLRIRTWWRGEIDYGLSLRRIQAQSPPREVLDSDGSRKSRRGHNC